MFTLCYFVISAIGVLLFRFLFKKSFLDLTEAGSLDKRERTLIVGAGHAGRMILTEIKNAEFDENNPARSILPVCFADDDITKLHTKIGGVEVVGICPKFPAYALIIQLIILLLRFRPAKRRKSVKSSTIVQKPNVK